MINILYAHTRAPNGGFGVLGKGILSALESRPDLFNVFFWTLTSTIPPFVPDIIFLYGMPELYNEVALTVRKHFKKKIPVVFYHVWESSALPLDFVRILKKPELLLTATEYTRKNDKAQGLNAQVLHHAVDDRFRYQERPDDGVFTFLHANAYEYRKGWEYVLEAFTKEFKPEEPVRLIMKARERKSSTWLLPREKRPTAEEWKFRRDHREEYLASLSLKTPNVEEVIGHVSDEELVNIFNRADCFVFPAKGEGWGLPPFEAAAMGIVPIIPNKGAFTEWYDPETMITVKTNGYIPTAPRYPGYMYSISLRDLRRKMRYAYENQDKLRREAYKLSTRIRTFYSWANFVDRFYFLVSNYLYGNKKKRTNL